MKQVFTNFTNALPSYVTEVRKWPGFERIADALERLQGRMLDKFYSAYEPRNWGYSVLCHNDFHIRNMMFHRGGVPGASPVKMMFIDFQCPFYGTPAIDLSVMMCSMVDQSVRDRCMEVYRNYYDWFVKALETYGYAGVPPSLVDLQIELLRQGGIGKGQHSRLYFKLSIESLQRCFIHYSSCPLSGRTRPS